MKVLCAENHHSANSFAHKTVHLTSRSLFVDCYSISRLLLFGRQGWQPAIEVCRLSNTLEVLQVSP